jgi:hypothetical protein
MTDRIRSSARRRPSAIVGICACLLTGLIVGCTQPEAAEPPTPTADAAPNRLSTDQFKAVDTQPFAVRGSQGKFAFTTPGGQSCTMTGELIQCESPILELSPGMWRFTVAGDSRRGTLSKLDAPPTSTPATQLERFQKIVLADGRAVCGVEESDGVSCEWGGHGFIIDSSVSLF